jgi:predicted nucleic acid-binding protein
MIFLDTNYFLRLIAPPATPQDEVMTHQSAALFRAARNGSKEITTSDAVLAEVAFILTSAQNYKLSPAAASARLKPLLQLRGFRAADKKFWLRALDIWESSPRLGFVDALTASYAEQSGIELATFDADFNAFPSIVRYQP